VAPAAPVGAPPAPVVPSAPVVPPGSPAPADPDPVLREFGPEAG
jgi:hypothetical protein